jgi:hypothetical protein
MNLSWMIDRARTKYHEEGLLNLFADTATFIYNRVVSKFCLWYNTTFRRILPRSGEHPVAYGGIKMGGTYEKRLFDGIVPWRTPYDNPRWGSFDNYEPELVDALGSIVQEGDSVVIVGAGRGVTTAVAAKKAGSSGHLIAYEAQPRRVEDSRATINANGVDKWTEIREGVIGEAIHIPEGDRFGHFPKISVDSIPECDVLELDCEGAELQILKELSIRPRTIIVEGHDCYGSPEKELRTLLSEMKYEIVDRDPQDEDRGIVILTAIQQ